MRCPSGAIQGLANAFNSLGHPGFTGNIQAQLPGNVIHPGRIEWQAAGINGGNQILGALLQTELLLAVEVGFEPEERSFREHGSSFFKKP